MKAKPILMHGRSIRSLLAGRKMQTRRIVKPQPEWVDGAHGATRHRWEFYGGGYADHGEVVDCPKGQPGDLLYVRETWDAPFRWHAGYAGQNVVDGWTFDRNEVIYRVEDDHQGPWEKWRPSIHMPRWASRLTLHLTDVRVERVQEITAADILAEGVELTGKYKAIDGADWDASEFAELWDATNGSGAWLRNDWVWVLTFELIEANVDDVLADLSSYGIPEAG